MAPRDIDRRSFITTGARAGLTACGLCACSGLVGWAADEAREETLDPKTLNYCGYRCPADCTFLRGTLSGDEALKAAAWQEWKIEERFGVGFDAAQAFCYGCKAPGKPDGFVVAHCDVRSCVIERKLDCCIECDELRACDKDLWRRFPAFKDKVIAMQEKFRAQV